MPIATEDELTYRQMQDIAQSEKRCGQCGGSLTVAWGGNKYNTYILRCGRDIGHKVIRQRSKKTELEREGEKIFGRNKGMKDTTALQVMPKKEMLERINQAKFPKDLTAVDRQRIAVIAIEYGLDPLMQELMIYQGQPYVTLAARLRKAQETEQLEAIDTRPATKEEKTARGLAEDDYLSRAEVWKVGMVRPFVGWGTVKAKETKGSAFLPVVNDPASHAEKRAIARALKLGFHLPLPSAEDVTAMNGGVEVEVMPKPQPSPEQGKGQPVGQATLAQRQELTRKAEAMGYKPDEMRAIIKKRYGVETSADLTTGQIQELIGFVESGGVIGGEEPPVV